MMKSHKDSPKGRTPHEQESIQRQIAVTDKAIGALVYELYGLTEDEGQKHGKCPPQPHRRAEATLKLRVEPTGN
jgi:hypothetical protein